MKFIQKIFSVKNENNHKIWKFFGIKMKFLNLKKVKYILYRRYAKTIIKTRLKHAVITNRNFLDFLTTYNMTTYRIMKRIIWRLELLKFIFNKKISISVFDFNITTRCSLRCEACGSMMPFYPSDKMWTIDFEQFKQDVDKLLSAVDKIYIFKLIGGEPLLVRDLAKMAEYCAKKKKIKHIEIITNSTILFPQDLLNVMKKYRNKFFVVISDYSSNKNLKCLKYNQIKIQLSLSGIKYLFLSYPWYERGSIYYRNRNICSLKKILKKCWQKDCIALMDGKFHLCTRSSAIQRLTDFNFSADEYIDIRKETPNSLAKKLRSFFLKDCFRVCSFCMEPSAKRIPRAIQTNELQKIGCKDVRTNFHDKPQCK